MVHSNLHTMSLDTSTKLSVLAGATLTSSSTILSASLVAAINICLRYFITHKRFHFTLLPVFSFGNRTTA